MAEQTGFSRRADVRIGDGYTYINDAYTHPMPTAMPREGRIDLRDLERVVDNRTRLVEVSFVSMYNGFQHDLKAVCDLRTRAVRSSTPTSSRGSARCRSMSAPPGLDFAATATYHRKPMIDKLQRELPRLGFTPQTPEGSTSPIVTFAHRAAEGINRKLQDARVKVRVAQCWMRISPSVYNDMSDVDRLLNARL